MGPPGPPTHQLGAVVLRHRDLAGRRRAPHRLITVDADARWRRRCTTTSAATGTETATRSAWVDGLQASCDAQAETTSSGRVADQASLHGLPAKVRDWALSRSRCAAPTRPTTEREQRDAAGIEPKAPGGNAATPAALGRQAAAAPATQPDRPAHARRAAPALLTPPRSRTGQTCRADRIPAAVPGADRTQGGCPCRPEGGARLGNDSRLNGTDRLVLLQRRCRVRCVRTWDQEEGACCSSPCARSYPMTPILEAGGLTRARRRHSDRSRAQRGTARKA
jgi:hypothetical protein